MENNQILHPRGKLLKTKCRFNNAKQQAHTLNCKVSLEKPGTFCIKHLKVNCMNTITGYAAFINGNSIRKTSSSWAEYYWWRVKRNTFPQLGEANSSNFYNATSLHWYFEQVMNLLMHIAIITRTCFLFARFFLC